MVPSSQTHPADWYSEAESEDADRKDESEESLHAKPPDPGSQSWLLNAQKRCYFPPEKPPVAEFHLQDDRQCREKKNHSRLEVDSLESVLRPRQFTPDGEAHTRLCYPLDVPLGMIRRTNEGAAFDVLDTF